MVNTLSVDTILDFTNSKTNVLAYMSYMPYDNATGVGGYWMVFHVYYKYEIVSSKKKPYFSGFKLSFTNLTFNESLVDMTSGMLMP